MSFGCTFSQYAHTHVLLFFFLFTLYTHIHTLSFVLLRCTRAHIYHAAHVHTFITLQTCTHFTLPTHTSKRTPPRFLSHPPPFPNAPSRVSFLILPPLPFPDLWRMHCRSHASLFSPSLSPSLPPSLNCRFRRALVHALLLAYLSALALRRQRFARLRVLATVLLSASDCLQCQPATSRTQAGRQELGIPGVCVDVFLSFLSRLCV